MRWHSKLVVACALVVGCGGAVTDPSSTSSSTGSSGSSPPDSTAEPVPAPPRPPQREGDIVVHTTEVAPRDITIRASAFFGPKRESTGGVAEGCEIEAPPSPVDTYGPRTDNAGTIDVKVAHGQETSSLKLAFDPTRRDYETAEAFSTEHATGTVRVHGRGDVIPAFDVEVPALSPVRVLSPAPDAPIGSGDLKVSWTYDGEDVPAVVYLMSPRSVRCVAPKSRELTIPASLVEQSLGGKVGGMGILVLTIRSASVDSGDYRIRVTHNASTHVALTPPW